MDNPATALRRMAEQRTPPALRANDWAQRWAELERACDELVPLPRDDALLERAAVYDRWRAKRG